MTLLAVQPARFRVDDGLLNVDVELIHRGGINSFRPNPCKRFESVVREAADYCVWHFFERLAEQVRDFIVARSERLNIYRALED